MSDTSELTQPGSQPSSSFSCPRCGFEQSAAPECFRCGVVFAKMRPDPPARSRSTQSSEPQARASLAGGLLLALAAGFIAFLLVSRSHPHEPETFADRESFPKTPTPAPPSKEVLTVPLPQSPPAAARLPVAPSAPSPAPEQAPVERKLARLPYTWYEGSQGYRWAMQEAAEIGLPVAVYFYTDWCPYCRQLDREVLSRPEVLACFTHVIKVKINPEDGPEEEAISDRYRVGSYPSFFIQPSATAGAVKIQRRTADEFVAFCNAATRS